MIQDQLNSIAADLPDQMPLVAAQGDAPRLRNLRNLRLAMQLSPLLPMLFLLGVTLFGVRTLKGWLAWWGWSFLITGLIGAVLGLSGALPLRQALEDYVSDRMLLSMLPELAGALRSVLDQVLREIIEPAGWQALILAAVGLLMLIGAAIAARGQQRRLRRAEAETQVVP